MSSIIKKRKTVAIASYIETEKKEELRRIAVQNEISISLLISNIINYYLENKEAL